MTDPQIAIAMPLHTVDRKALRAIAGHSLPAIYPDSHAHPCARCAMTLAVGPRTWAQVEAGTVIVICPICLIGISGGSVPNIESLDNPDSKFEDE